jgi:hypothetical protein
MSGVVRLLLIWFIAAAVPLKGLAAVTMGGCGPEHHSPREAAATVAHATHGDFHEVLLELGAGNVVAGNQGAETGLDSSTGHSAQLKMKCSSCAPCCSVAAPAFARTTMVQAESASTAVAFLEIRFPAVFADVPHRPPRLILA